MSIKLPIIKQQQSPRSPKPPSKRGKPEEDLDQGQQEVYAEDDAFEHKESHPAPETVTALKARPDEHLEVEVKPAQKTELREEEKEGPSMQQLQQRLSQKVKISASLRASIQERKKEIKDIGEQIDKDLNKSLLKAAKPNTVNIRDIFSGTHKTYSHAVQLLNQHLNQTRVAIRKIKLEIQKAQEGLTDPVSLLNQGRGIEYKTKIQNTESQIKSIEREKTMLEEEISRGGKQFDQEEEKQRAEDLSKLHQQLYEIHNHQKEQKLKLYHIEKEDITLMEKVKFFQERQNLIGAKKQKLSHSEKEKLQSEMRQLIIDINQTMEDRNKTQSQQKKIIRQLAQEVASLESKNWDFFNKLRQIDAFLLQYYEKKTRKKQLKQMEKTIDVMDKPTSGVKEAHSVASVTLKKNKFSVNDKNVLGDAPLVEKKKSYEFGQKEKVEGEIILSDDFLGQKMIIRSIQIKSTPSKIVFISAQYQNQFGNQISGLLMGSRNITQKVDSQQLVLEKQEVVNFVHTGLSEENSLSFLHLVTSEGKELKWGQIENLAKSEQKHIKKYQSCLIKSKFLPQADPQEPFVPYLVGLTFLTTYLSPK